MRRPLARWGFTALTAFALLTHQPLPALTAGTLAAWSWHCRPGPR